MKEIWKNVKVRLIVEIPVYGLRYSRLSLGES
jgi:hypothetical protein